MSSDGDFDEGERPFSATICLANHVYDGRSPPYVWLQRTPASLNPPRRNRYSPSRMKKVLPSKPSLATGNALRVSPVKKSHRLHSPLKRFSSLFVLAAILLATRLAEAATQAWVGSAGSSDWATAANWNTAAPVSGDALVFTSTNLFTSGTLSNTLATTGTFGGINFTAGSPAYTMTGNTFRLATGITNSSSNLQTFANTGGIGLATTAETFDVTGAGITITNGIVNLFNGVNTITVTGAGNTLTLGGYNLNGFNTTNRVNIVNGTGNVNITGAITNGSSTASSISYTGSGTMTLGGANSYGGATTLNNAAGVLLVAGSNSGTGNTTVTAGTLQLGSSATNGGLASGTLTLTTATIQAVNGDRVLSSNVVQNGAVTVSGTRSLTLNGSITNSGAGRTLTNNIANGTLSLSNVYLSESVGAGRTYTITGAGNVLFSGTIANVDPALGAGAAGSLTFNTGFTGTATINGANTYSGVTTLSTGGAFVLGNKAAFGTSSVAINGVNVSANTNLSGANAIANASINLGGNNTFVGNNSIEFSGTVTETASRTVTNNISSGTLKMSGNVLLSTSELGRTLTVNGSGNTEISGNIANNNVGNTVGANLTYSGTGGSLKLSGSNTYSGATTVTAGTLILDHNNAAGSSLISVNGGNLRVESGRTIGNAISFGASGGTIGGNGTISSALALNNTNQILSPGNSPGILNLSASETWSSMTYKWEINNWAGSTAGTDFDKIAITGGLNLTGAASGSYILDLTSLTLSNVAGNVGNFTDTSNSWTILTTTTGITGFNASFWNLPTTDFTSSPAATGTWSLSVTNGGNDLTLAYTVVPEPASWVLLGIGFGVLVWRTRFRRA